MKCSHKKSPVAGAFLFDSGWGLTVHDLIEDGFEASRIIHGQIGQNFTVDFQ
jgi:hypothetical protein